VGKHRVFHRLLIMILMSTFLVTLPIVTSHQAATASTQARRVAAYLWAYHHRGDWYCWGGTGPSCFDCSGLIEAAYAHEGLHFGRTTYAMLASWRLVRERESQARPGDLAFYGTGHVEFFIRPGLTYGAAAPGTRIGWHRWNAWWHPTMFFRVRGAG
jgi:cell wall-associated NlpC family hydrolase